MAEYTLSAMDVVIRNADFAHIPPDALNADRQLYQQWLTEGGVPDPYVEPAPSSPPSPEQALQMVLDLLGKDGVKSLMTALGKLV